MNHPVNAVNLLQLKGESACYAHGGHSGKDASPERPHKRPHCFIELHQRDQLIALLDSEPDPVELVAFLTRRFAPPVLTNTEGDPLVFCDATLQVSDPAALTAALDETYDRDDDAPQWLEHVTTHGMERNRTFLRLDGRSTIVRCRGASWHSTRTWWRARSGTRAAHQRCTRATSSSGRGIRVTSRQRAEPRR